MTAPRFIAAITIIISVYGSANLYVLRRLYQWLCLLFPGINAKIYIVICIIAASSIILGFAPLPITIKFIASRVGAYWMGTLMYMLIFVFLADIAVFFGSLAKMIPAPVPHNVQFFKGLITMLLTVGVLCYGIYNANQIKIVSYDVSLGKNTLSDELKVVLIADLHFGTVNSKRNLAKIVDGINSLEPDIVCIAGDIFNDDYKAIRDPDRVVSLLKSIETTYGVFACLGNHDGGPTLPQMISLLEDSNIRLLCDEYVVIGGQVALFGRLDPSPIGGFGSLHRQDISGLISSVREDFPVIVMEHTPSRISEYGAEVDLILAGHTHSGQVFPGGLITKAIFAVDYGHYISDEDSPDVLVTSGINTWGPPIRVGTNNEIVSIVLR